MTLQNGAYFEVFQLQHTDRTNYKRFVSLVDGEVLYRY